MRDGRTSDDGRGQRSGGCLVTVSRGLGLGDPFALGSGLPVQEELGTREHPCLFPRSILIPPDQEEGI